jgi:hypothetical protein
MLDDINEIITKHLPAQVGVVLQKRLALADEADRKIVEQGTIIKDLKAKVTSLETENAAAREILKREKDLVEAEADLHDRRLALDSQDAVLKARSDIINHLLERDERILGLVFGNNRFKYNQNIQEQVAFAPAAPTAQQPCPYPQTAQQSRSVQIEGEGQVPAVPAGPVGPA